MIAFSQIVESRIEKIRRILGAKGAEYAAEGDRFHNFHVAARVDDETPRKALWGMAKKHLVSVIDLVNEHLDDDYADEKIGDMVNYLILLEGLIAEERVRREVEQPFP